MSVDVSLWVEVFESDAFPPFPCPRCRHGRLSLQKKSLRLIEPGYSTAAHAHEGWDESWVTHRFAAVMECSNPTCQEIVIVSGKSEPSEQFDDEVGHYYDAALRPKAIFPAPPIISLPDGTPGEIQAELKRSFALFWTDLSAAANRLRAALERFMDEQGVKKFTRNKQGKRVPMSLSSRLDLFEKKNGNEHSEILGALRQIGNLGSHADVSRDAVLAAYDLFEHVLVQVYDQPKKRVAKLVRAVTKKKRKKRASPFPLPG